MSSLFALLEKIKMRPGLYLGAVSITHLRMFLVGYRHARAEMKIPNTQAEIDFYKNFQPWLQNHLAIRNTRSWDQLILSKCIGEKYYSNEMYTSIEVSLIEASTVDEEKYAFKCFFELLAEFRQRDPSLDVDPILLVDSYEDTEQVVAGGAAQNR